MDIKNLKTGDKVLVECTVQAVFANSKMVMVTTRDCTEGFDAYIDEIQEPKTGHWTEEFNDLEGEVRFTCSSCGKYQLFGTDFCYHCGSDNREVEE